MYIVHTLAIACVCARNRRSSPLRSEHTSGSFFSTSLCAGVLLERCTHSWHVSCVTCAGDDPLSGIESVADRNRKKQ